VDPKSMFEMGPILAEVAELCRAENCTPIVAHHFVKRREDPYGPACLEDLAFSGVNQFVRQWMLLSRRERYDPLAGVHKFHFTYAGSAGHSGELFLDIDAGRTTEDLENGRKWAVSLYTPGEGLAARDEQAKAARDAKQAEKDREKREHQEQSLLADV